MEPEQQQKRVAVVGTGISGLASAWALAREGCAVTVFERDERLGGHSWTFPGDGADRPPVDLGFQVFNFTTYPYLTQMFEELGVEHEPSDMSFALSVDDGRVEWASHGLDSIFAQRRNVVDPGFMYMMREVVRFGNQAEEVLPSNDAAGTFSNMTLGAYLALRGYSARFKSDYLLPTTAAVWSVPNAQMLDFPVVPLVAFMANHHLLSPFGDRPRWRVVTGRSNQYVLAIEKALQEMGAEVLLRAPVTQVCRAGGADGDAPVQVTFARGDGPAAAQETREFDHVVMACHSDTAAALLVGDGVAAERALAAEIRYQPNKVVLHGDARLMPKSRRAWSSWNVLDKQQTLRPEEAAQEKRDLCTTYWLNHLQNLPPSAPLLLCTLNPIVTPDPALVITEAVLDHPVFDTAAMAAQREINALQAAATADTRSVWFAGAWLGSGFHEDGIRAALAVVTSLASRDGKTPPDWARAAGAPESPALTLVRGPDPGKSVTQRLGMRVFRSVAAQGIRRGFMRLLLPDGNDAAFGRATAADACARGEPVVTLRVRDLGMFAKAVTDSDIGLGEAFMHRMFETRELPALFDVLILNNESLRAALNPLSLSAATNMTLLAAGFMYCAGNVVSHVRHMLRDNTVAGSRKNIEEHYDVGNDMYRLFLDSSMTYSSGLHRREHGAANARPGEVLPLHEAQLAKLDALIRKAGIGAGDHVLEIGCGWGSFAIRAATATGCRVTGITISTEQLAEARARVEKAGVADRVNLIICDYRKMGIPLRGATEMSAQAAAVALYDHGLAPGSFDKIVSIEMLEAVGHDHLPEYFETVERMLKPGGKAVIQVISIPDARYKEYCSTSDFIRKHIFPGGHLPCEAALRWATADTDLHLEQLDDIGPDYAITLRMWRERFLAKRDEISALGYPDAWIRCFDFYFAYCESGFENKYILNYHLTFAKDAEAKRAAAQGGSGGAAHGGSAVAVTAVERYLLPASISFAVWIGVMALTLDPRVRQVASICCLAGLFSIAVHAAMPAIDPAMATASRRAQRRFRLVLVQLLTSAFVCAVVAGLIGFHEVLYTTRVASAAPWLRPEGEGSLLNLSEIHFCDWHSDQQACQQGGDGDAGVLGKLYVRSPMHFVVGCLAFASVTRLLLDMGVFNGMHAAALLVLNVLAHSAEPHTASTALGLAIVHGVSELHATVAAARRLMAQRGLGWGDALYRNMWAADVSSLLVIRWLPVPVLLSPVILRAPWAVFLCICLVAARETAVLVRALFELKGDYENRVNTDELLPEARSKKELIDALVGATTDAHPVDSCGPTLLQGSRFYRGTVFHQRRKVAGASPGAHLFTFPVWMALVDLHEARRGQAFRAHRFVSADGGSNLFSWRREDHLGDMNQPLDDCVRALVQRETGRALAPDARILLLTNLRCFGFVFNPVSVYYCLSASGAELDAVVLEVSNTPWRQKRLYVLPFFEHGPDDLYRAAWRKDFHVSPFMDVFYNYDWTLSLPADALSVRAYSTRREPEDDGAEEAPQRKGEAWAQQLVDAPTQLLHGAAQAEVFARPDADKVFTAGLNLQRVPEAEAWRALLSQPLLAFSVVLYIHVHAVIVMVRKGCEQKLTPTNAPPLGAADALRHLAVFVVAGAVEMVAWPLRKLRG